MTWLTKHDPIIVWSKHQLVFNSDLCIKDCLTHVTKDSSKDHCDPYLIPIAEKQLLKISVVSASAILEDLEDNEFGWIDVSNLNSSEPLSIESVMLYLSNNQVNT